jgi:hypothetical protein
MGAIFRETLRPASGSYLQRGVVVPVAHVDTDTALDQKLDQIQMPPAGGQVQRRPAVIVLNKRKRGKVQKWQVTSIPRSQLPAHGM